MFLDKYFNKNEGNINVSPQQASSFAKKVAGDFNPIHDEEAKRFCVPGDLLFALVLNNYGLSQTMNFTFSGRVGDGVELVCPDDGKGAIKISDSNGKDYRSIECEGETSTDPGTHPEFTPPLCRVFRTDLPAYPRAINGRTQYHDQPGTPAGDL